MTKARAVAIARRARQYGYHDTGSTLYLKCPECGEKVETDRQPVTRVSIVKQLDAMMLYHLDGMCDSEVAR